MAHPLRSSIYASAAATLGAAVCFALTSGFGFPLLLGASLGAIVFARVAITLSRAPAPTPPVGFDPAPLEFAEELGELVLDRPVPAASPSSRVVQLFGPPLTPGQMHEAIERHLSGAPSPAPDATEELRQALAQLRRAVR